MRRFLFIFLLLFWQNTKKDIFKVVKMGNMKNFHSLLDALPLLASPKEEGLPGASDFQNRFLT